MQPTFEHSGIRAMPQFKRAAPILTKYTPGEVIPRETQYTITWPVIELPMLVQRDVSPVRKASPIRLRPNAARPNQNMAERQRPDRRAAPGRDIGRRDASPPRHDAPRVVLPAVTPDLTATRRMEIFWELIAGLGWRNMSEGAMMRRTVDPYFARFERDHWAIFGEFYKRHYDVLFERLTADGMFGRNAVNDPHSQAQMTSHAIALGRDQYNTLLTDLELYQFLITAGECQSLNNCLPANMQIK